MAGDQLSEALTILGFLSIFHIIGGVAVGVGLRKWRSAWKSQLSRTPPFLLLWGILFGGMPLIFGLAGGLRSIFVAQAVILLASVAVTFWFFDPLKEMLSHQYMFLIAFGGVFIVVGVIVGGLMIRTETGWQALLAGSIFLVVGTLILASGVAQWLKEMRRTDDEVDADS